MSLTPERWRTASAVLATALEHSPAERLALVAAACGADVELRTEVESLLAAAERGEDSLRVPTAWRAAALMADATLAPPTESGDRDAPDLARLAAALDGRYAVERELGRGGMATVYLARDLRHRRPVALKVLHAGLGALLGPDRFRREIETAANLRHPHILPLFDSGEADGLLYYSMPYVPGESLRERLARAEGPLPVAEALLVLREVVDALAHAHRHGVVHRDVKPANILLADGHAVVADFGIARAVRLAREPETAEDPAHYAELSTLGPLTDAGSTPGTPAYMAPEQARGDAMVDHRADLYALGVVAYELLAGAHPFGPRSTQALLTAHLSEPVPPLGMHRPDLPPGVTALVMRLLEKDPNARPQTADEVLGALDASTVVPRSAPSDTGRVRNRRALGWVFVTILLVAASAAGYAAWRGMRTSSQEERARAPSEPVTAERRASGVGNASAIRTVAVLPFVNTSGVKGDDYFSDGLTDELAHALARLPGLRVTGRTSSRAFTGRIVSAQEIGRALGVSAFVSGTVRRAGDRVRVTPQLVSTIDGAVLWDSVYESRSADVFAVQDQLTRAISAALVPALEVRDAGHPAVNVVRGTADQEAYELYLKGRYAWLQRGTVRIARAIALFRQAIARDPDFARAHAGLAMAYSTLPNFLPDPTDSAVALATASARRAVTLDSTLADAQIAMGLALDVNLQFADALVRYRKGLALEPSSANGHHQVGMSLLNLGRTAEAVAELRQATEADPLAPSPASAFALSLLYARRFPEARAAAHRALALDSTFAFALWPLGLAQAFGGQPDSAIRTFERGTRVHPDDSRMAAALLFANAAAGHWVEASRIRAQLHHPGGDRSGWGDAAVAELVFGDREPLLHVLTTTASQRHYLAAGALLGCNPLLDPLWPDARFSASMRALGVQRCQLARPWPIPSRPDSSAAHRTS